VAAAVLGALGLGGADAAAADDARACVAAADQAQQLRDEGKLKDARQQMLVCARDTCPAGVRKDCSGWLSALDASLPSIVVSAEDASRRDLIQVRVLLDGKPLLSSLDGRAIPIDPGPHTLRFEAEGQTPIDQTVLIREGEQRRSISVRFPPPGAPGASATAANPPDAAPPESPRPPSPSRVPVAAITVGAVGLVALGSFAFFGITGKNDLANLHATCGVTHTCAQSDVDATRTRLIVADVSLGVSVVAIGVATVLFFTQRSHPPPKSSRRAGATMPYEPQPMRPPSM